MKRDAGKKAEKVIAGVSQREANGEVEDERLTGAGQEARSRPLPPGSPLPTADHSCCGLGLTSG